LRGRQRSALGYLPTNGVPQSMQVGVVIGKPQLLSAQILIFDTLVSYQALLIQCSVQRQRLRAESTVLAILHYATWLAVCSSEEVQSSIRQH
jgi:hypothetical protein